MEIQTHQHQHFATGLLLPVGLLPILAPSHPGSDYAAGSRHREEAQDLRKQKSDYSQTLREDAERVKGQFDLSPYPCFMILYVIVQFSV